MNLLHFLSKKDVVRQGGFTVNGNHGCVTAWPDGKRRLNGNNSEEPTYFVDAVYFDYGSSIIKHLRESGFRQSTVCCLCACIFVGEKALDAQLIDRVNQWFNSG